MNSPPPLSPPAPPLSDQIFPMDFPPPNLDEPSSTPFEWANLLDFTFGEDQFNLSWSPDNPTVDTTSISPQLLESASEEASNRGGGGSDSSDKIRKRDPRLTCENFLAGRIPCACPELDEMLEEEGELGKKRPKTTASAASKSRCQVPGCEVDISELKGYHKRHRVCLRCATATSVVLDGETKRYCQQCGKFHILPDFDEGKRSCRRKLERHNKRRRRKPAEFRGSAEKETQIDQLAEDIASVEKTGKDETLNDSEDGNASPDSSRPGSQSVQSGSVKSFVTFDETQMEGEKDTSKYSSFGDDKNAYSTVCPTGRISFKLYDWNPAEFPRRLRHQIFQWLASMPVELEGYIRPGCTILTVYITMPHIMWEKLSEDASRHIHNFINAPESMLFGRGSMTIYYNDMIFRALKGGTSLMNVKMEALAPRLHYVHPSIFEAGKPMEFVACGSNLLQSRFRFLVSFSGQYLAYDKCHVIPYGRSEVCFRTKEDTSKHCEHQMYKIHISNTDPTLGGPAFIEVESEFGISNFIPVLFGDKHICSEMKIVQERLDDILFSKENQHADVISEQCKGFELSQAAISELLLDIGWLLREPKLDDIQNNLTLTQIQRSNCLLSFFIRNESTTLLEKILHSLKIVMDVKKFNHPDNANNHTDMRLLQKNLEHAREIVHHRLKDMGEQILCSSSSVGKGDYWSECYRENDMLSAVPSTSEDMKMPKNNNLRPDMTAFQNSSEAVPLINKDVVMNLTYEPHAGKVWPQKTCNRSIPSTILSPRPLFLMVVAGVMCFGICAVVLHPSKVGEFAVTIRRCLFGSFKT